MRDAGMQVLPLIAQPGGTVRFRGVLKQFGLQLASQ